MLILTHFRNRNITHHKETNSADILAKVYTKVMRTLDFVKMVEVWQWIVLWNADVEKKNRILSILQSLPSKQDLLEGKIEVPRDVRDSKGP